MPESRKHSLEEEIGDKENLEHVITGEISEVIGRLSLRPELAIEDEVDVNRYFSQRPHLKEETFRSLHFKHSQAGSMGFAFPEYVKETNGKLLFIQHFFDQEHVTTFEGNVRNKLIASASNLPEYIDAISELNWQTTEKKKIVFKLFISKG